MFCTKCGKEIDENVDVCPACGTSIKPVATSTNAKTNGSLLKGSFVNDRIDSCLASLRKISWDRGFDKAEMFTNSIGTWGYYLLAVFSLIAYPILFSKIEMGGTGFLIGLVFLVFCFFFGYCGTKLYSSIRNLIDNIPSSVSSMNVIDVIAVIAAILAVFGSITCFIASRIDLVAMLMSATDVSLVLVGVVLLFAGAYICVMLIGSQKLLGVKVEKCGSAEEFLGLITLFIKMLTRLTPFIWGAGAFAALVIEIQALSSDGGDFFAYTGLAAYTAVITGLLPLIVYINYIMCNFILDFAKSVLSVPGKIDSLKK